MIKLEEMATSQLTAIASRIYYDMELIMDFGEQPDWDRLPALQMTYDAIEAELGDREAAAKWYEEQKEYAAYMAARSTI